MFLRFEVLDGTITLNGTVSGSRGAWKVSISAPGCVVAEDETTERNWHTLFEEMLATAFKNASRRRFPERSALAAGEGGRR
jgi:hypothetical protein